MKFAVTILLLGLAASSLIGTGDARGGAVHKLLITRSVVDVLSAADTLSASDIASASAHLLSTMSNNKIIQFSIINNNNTEEQEKEEKEKIEKSIEALMFLQKY
ncbi:uncharacterized protein O3C94_003101 [Discoglossus pictus]